MANYLEKKALAKNSTLLYFPDTLSDEDFKHRRLVINIHDIKQFTEVGMELYKKALTSYDSTKDTTKDDTGDKKWYSTASDTGKNVAVSTMKTLARSSEYGGKVIHQIVLPLPNELSDSSQHTYASKEGIASALLGMVPGVNIAQEEIFNRAANHMGMQKVMANPGFFQNYTGTEPRTFKFGFKLIPNSKAEAEKIIKIINLLKKYSSPSTIENTAGALMTAPNFFTIFVSNNTLQNLLNIQPCVITSIETNYATSGILEMTVDGMPKFLTLTIGIAEVRSIEQKDWNF